MRRSPLTLLAAALLILHPLAVIAEQKATIEEILDGPELYIDRSQARVKQKAKAPQTISTGVSRGQIRFSGGATGRINRNSLMKLGQSCFWLNQGQVLISGPQNACTRSTRLSVRGTNFLLEVNDRQETQLSVLEGSVDLELLRDGLPVPDALPRVGAGERLQFSEVSGALSLMPLSRDDVAAILRGPLFRDFRKPLAEQKALKRQLRQSYPDLDWNPPQAVPDGDAVEQMRSLLEQMRAINAGLERVDDASSRSVPEPNCRGNACVPMTRTVPFPTPTSKAPFPADARLVDWERQHQVSPSGSSCWSSVQAYYDSIGRVYRDWQAPKPSRKGRFVTRIDFDIVSAGPNGPVQANNFVITQPSGEDPQDRSALAEAMVRQIVTDLCGRQAAGVSPVHRGVLLTISARV